MLTHSTPPPFLHPFLLTSNPNPNHLLYYPSPHRCNLTVSATGESRLQNSTSLLTPTPTSDSDPTAAAAIKFAETTHIEPKRVVRFPGAVDVITTTSSASLRLVAGAGDGLLRRAIDVRRSVAAEALVAALRAGRLSITYSNNLVRNLGDFVDRIVIEAAELKRDPLHAHMSFNARAKSFIHSSEIVPLVKWLKHNSLTYPQIGKIICSCTGSLDKVRRLVTWLRSNHVKGEYVGRVLARVVSVLSRSFEELEEIVGYLEDNGVKKDWMGIVVSRCPQLLTLSFEELEMRVKFYQDMGINEKDFGTMVYDCPKALGFFSLEEMNSKVQYLKEFGLNTEEVGRVLAYKPQLMNCSIEERWKPLVKYLYYLNIRRDGMKRMLMVKPMIFCVDLERTIAPKVQFLQDIGIRTDAIGSVLVRFPAILTYNLHKKIRPVVIFLMTKGGVTNQNIAKAIASDPQLVGCSIINKLETNVKYFRSLGIHQNVLGEMIADFPMMLRYNLDVLRPKYRYLRRVMVRPLKDLIEFPRFFSYSLEERIIPRHEILVANRINMKLRYMLAGTDEDFNQQVKDYVGRRERFEAGEASSEIVNSVSNEPSTTTSFVGQGEMDV